MLQLNSIFYTLPLEFTSLENVFTLVVYLLNSPFLFDLVRCTFSQRDKQIFIHCYFLLVLMPEPVLYIWLRCQVCIRYSRAAFFNSTFEFLFTLQWSLVETKEAFVGVGDGDLSTSSPGLSLGNTRLPPQAKILLALLKHAQIVGVLCRMLNFSRIVIYRSKFYI